MPPTCGAVEHGYHFHKFSQQRHTGASCTAPLHPTHSTDLTSEQSQDLNTHSTQIVCASESDLHGTKTSHVNLFTFCFCCCAPQSQGGIVRSCSRGPGKSIRHPQHLNHDSSLLWTLSSLRSAQDERCGWGHRTLQTDVNLTLGRWTIILSFHTPAR